MLFWVSSKVEPIAHAARCSTPALYAHGREDSFVRPHHTEWLHERHASEHKELLLVDGNHNSCRPAAFLDATSRFLFQHLLSPDEQASLGAPLKVYGNTPATQNAKCFYCKQVRL